MTGSSFRDISQLSALLDGQLSHRQSKRINTRLQVEPSLAADLDEMRQVRLLLRKTPKRPVPHAFTLTSAMAGIKPPVPRLVPALSWASLTAVLVFIFSFGSSMMAPRASQAPAPMLAAAPAIAGKSAGPLATQPPASENSDLIPTTQPAILMNADATIEAVPTGPLVRVAPPVIPAAQPAAPAIELRQVIWLALAGVLIIAALLARVINIHLFRRKLRK